MTGILVGYEKTTVRGQVVPVPTIRIAKLRVTATKALPDGDKGYPTSLWVSVNWPVNWHYTTTHILPTSDMERWKRIDNSLIYTFSNPVALSLPAFPSSFVNHASPMPGIIKLKLKWGRKTYGECKILAGALWHLRSDEESGLVDYCLLKPPPQLTA